MVAVSIETLAAHAERSKMDQAEFDRFADEYHQQHRENIAITGEEPAYFAAYKIERLASAASDLAIAPDDILDFGSGIGNSIPHFRHFLPTCRLVCADVSKRSLDLARTRFVDGFTSSLIEDRRISAPDESFSISFSACVFHHIPHDEHVHWLSELRRVTRSGGMLCIFEHNPLNPLTVRAVNTCPFDVNAHLIRARVLAKRFRAAGWTKPTIAYHVFFPHFLSRLRTFDPHLSRLPIGAQYSVTATKSF